MSTKGYGGRSLTKSIRVYTNDPKNEKITLHLSGKVKNFVTVKPSKVFLKGAVGENISRTVIIIPGEGETFKILKVNALKGQDFKYSLKDIKVEGDKPAYELTVENTRQTEGRYFDKIFIITDRTDQAPINIIVSGYIEKPKDVNSEPQKPEAQKPEAQKTDTTPETEPTAE